MYTDTSHSSTPDFQLRHGHDGLVLCLDWSAATGRIVSGGEDCKYRVGRIFLSFCLIAYLQVQGGQNILLFLLDFYNCKYKVGRIFLCFGLIAYLQVQSGQNRIFLLSVSLVYLPGLAV